MSVRARVLIAVLALAVTSRAARAQDVQLVRPSEGVVEITGGAPDSGWQLRYGSRGGMNARLYPLTPGRAYFTHGSWLRLLDTDRGIVLGRWRYPGMIVAVTTGPDLRASIEFEAAPWTGGKTRSESFDPDNPQVPGWEQGSLTAMIASSSEGAALLHEGAPRVPDPWSAPATEPERRARQLEDTVNRDPSAPWLKVALGKLWLDARDPRAPAVFQAAVQVPDADFAELFRISAMLDQFGFPALAVDAYDRAYTVFLARGNDPRLLTMLIGRLILYSPLGRGNVNLLDPQGGVLLDRSYRISPTGEATDRAWTAVADYLARNGRGEEAATWRGRAAATSRESLYPATRDILLAHDRVMLVAAAAAGGAAVFVIALYVKYRPQRRLLVASQKRGGMGRMFRFGLFNIEYWSRRERAVLLVIVLIGWYAVGLGAAYARVATKAAAMPIAMGSFAGPSFTAYFRNDLPPSAERTLLLAIAHHQGAELVEAERGYREVPQFAASWNNLGVISSGQGRQVEAAQAFARALAIDPNLDEARVNTGQAPQTLASQMHQRYLPGAPMIALPNRDQIMRAYLGDVLRARYWRALAGPFAAMPPGPGNLLRGFSALWVSAPALLLALLVSLASLMFIPYRDVTLTPGRAFTVFELLVPGISARWSVLAAPVVVLWSSLVLSVVLLTTTGTPYVMTANFSGGTLRAFGLREVQGVADLNPNPLILGGLIAVLLSSNLIFIWRPRRA